MSQAETVAARISYLVERHRAYQEEFLFRVSHRDRWLTIEMVVQAILFGAAFGVSVSGVEVPGRFPWLLVLSGPVALLFALLYVVEDRTIGLVLRHQRRLHVEEAALAGSEPIRDGLSADFQKHGARLRLGAQFVAFILLPAALLGSFVITGTAGAGVVIGEVLLLAFIAWLLRWARSQRDGDVDE